MHIVEIFSSIEGEGIRAGYLCTFIRTYGCNLSCVYCDSMYACEKDNYIDMNIDSILSECVRLGNRRVTITGGEPLLQPNMDQLIACLLESDFEVNVETNGSLDVSTTRNSVMSKCTENISNLFFTIDFKCPFSGMESHMQRCNYIKNAKKFDVVKFVVSDIQDLDAMCVLVKIMTDVLSNKDLPHIFVSPVFGKIELVEIVDYLKKYNLQDVRLQIQLHKIIWNPDERGV